MGGTTIAKQQGAMAMSKPMFSKWCRWLDQIYRDQLHDLLVNQHIFHQFGECTKLYIGKYTAGELAHWMNQGYIAFAATAVRRMIEEPPPTPVERRCPKCGHLLPLRKPKSRQQSLSLVVLLRDLANHTDLLTVERYRAMYRTLARRFGNSVARRFADRDFAIITRSRNATKMPSSRINRDIAALKRVAEPVRRLVNKVIAHTEADRRRRGKMTYEKLNAAIALLAETFKTYSLLINGKCLTPLVPFSGYDVTKDLNKLWPKSDH